MRHRGCGGRTGRPDRRRCRGGRARPHRDRVGSHALRRSGRSTGALVWRSAPGGPRVADPVPAGDPSRGAAFARRRVVLVATAEGRPRFGHGPAEDVARRIGRTIPLVYGSTGVSAVAARRWKTQINENAKTPAFFAVQPELSHNEVAGWGQHGDVTRQVLSLITLRHGGEHPHVARRFELVVEATDEVMANVIPVWAEGDDDLARFFDLALFGDFVSLHMAGREGPTPARCRRSATWSQRCAVTGPALGKRQYVLSAAPPTRSAQTADLQRPADSPDTVTHLLETLTGEPIVADVVRQHPIEARRPATSSACVRARLSTDRRAQGRQQRIALRLRGVDVRAERLPDPARHQLERTNDPIGRVLPPTGWRCQREWTPAPAGARPHPSSTAQRRAMAPTRSCGPAPIACCSTTSRCSPSASGSSVPSSRPHVERPRRSPARCVVRAYSVIAARGRVGA